MLISAIPPFDGDTDREIIYSVRKLNYEFHNPEFEHVSEGLKDLIKKILVEDDERLSID